MELAAITHVPSDDLTRNFNPDLFITASGFESRATAIAKMVDERSARNFALGYKEFQKEYSRPENDRYFQSRGYTIQNWSSEETPDFATIMDLSGNKNPRVMIDISSMTHRWYHGLFRYLHSGMHNFEKLELRVAYYPSEFAESGESRLRRVESLCPDRGPAGDGRKTALFMGINQDAGSARKIVELIRPDSLYLFYPDPASEKRYIETVFINNHSLIDSISIRNLIAYPINNGQQIYQMLSDLALMLRLNHKVIAVPRGPKIFSLVNMALQLSYPDIQICYPDIKMKKLIDRKPTGNPVVLDLVFEKD